MTRINWDHEADRIFSAGVDRGVLYPPNSSGVVWNGLVSVQASTANSEIVTIFIDGEPYKTEQYTGDYEGIITAFTYPPEFEPFDGYQTPFYYQDKQAFGLSYRLTQFDAIGGTYSQIHLIYNATTKADEKRYETTGDTDLEPFSWTLTAMPTKIDGLKSSSHLIIDSRYAYSTIIAKVEDILYGTDDEEPRLPTPDELNVLFDESSILTVIDHGDGTWTASGPDEIVHMLNDTLFEITDEGAVYINETTYTLSDE